MNFVTDDLRLVLRAVRRAPGFATIVILTIGLGIGANTAIYEAMANAIDINLFHSASWRRSA